MKNAYDVLLERGFIEQLTHEDEIKELLAKEKVTFYVGFDPTADSLHVGHFVPIMAMAHMQRAGHRPIALIGGGTTRVGDPTGKTDMRKMLTDDDINHNAEQFKGQLSRFIDFNDDKAIMINNADWLLGLNYIDFLREIGAHFSVNRMLAAECYKQRMEKGLTFLEFNYMIMQSYDFLALNRQFGCNLQIGGNDQWSNIIGGVELIRKKEQKSSFGMTLSLLTTSEGKKMGKTEKGAVWLDANKTTPFEFFQYWRNVEDQDVAKCLALLTFLPMDEVNRLSALEGSEINKAKEVLAFELTKIIHGEDEAQKSLSAAKALFAKGGNMDDAPSSEIALDTIKAGLPLVDVLVDISFAQSKGEGKRLIKQSGIKVNGKVAPSFDFVLTEDNIDDGKIMISKGKKKFHQLMIK